MGATISEALEALKNADKQEFEDEISILEEEVENLKKQIDSRRRVIRQVKQFAGIRIINRGSKSNGSTSANGNGDGDAPKVWELARNYLEVAGPSSAAKIAGEIGKHVSGVALAMTKREGHEFRQLADKRWCLVSQINNPEND